MATDLSKQWADIQSDLQTQRDKISKTIHTTLVNELKKAAETLGIIPDLRDTLLSNGEVRDALKAFGVNGAKKGKATGAKRITKKLLATPHTVQQLVQMGIADAAKRLDKLKAAKKVTENKDGFVWTGK